MGTLRECINVGGTTISGVPDNLGNHTATQTLNMAGFGIYNTSGININTTWELAESSGQTLAFQRAGTQQVAITTSGLWVRSPSLDNSVTNVLVWHSGGSVKRRTVSTLETGTTLLLGYSGSGTGASPYTHKHLVYTNESGTVAKIDFRDTTYFTQGQAGGLIIDGIMDNQPRYIVPSGYQVELTQVYATLGKAGTTATALQIFVANDPGDGTAPTTGSPTSTLSIPADAVYVKWTALAGTVLLSEQHVQSRIDTAGSGAESLVIHFWGRTTR